MFTLVQLRCFVAVAEDLNLHRAAKRLNMTQPPLTRHIQALEHQVGAMLLDRSSRALRLTPAGQSLEKSARRILDEAAEATHDAQKVARGDAGGLTLAFTAASSYAFLPRLITLLRERMPALALTLRELTTPEQIEALKARQVDLCLLRPPISIPGIQTMRVYRERLVLAVPSQHDLANWPEVNLGDLSGQMLITYPPIEGPYFHRLVMGLISCCGGSPSWGAAHHSNTLHLGASRRWPGRCHRTQMRGTTPARWRHVARARRSGRCWRRAYACLAGAARKPSLCQRTRTDRTILLFVV